MTLWVGVPVENIIQTRMLLLQVTLGLHLLLGCCIIDEMEVKHSATVEGRRAYLEENSPSSITKNRMDSTFFMIRKDGQSHPMISAADGLAANCQLCRYKFQHVKEGSVKECCDEK
jgi:hypothetical protein